MSGWFVPDREPQRGECRQLPAVLHVFARSAHARTLLGYTKEPREMRVKLQVVCPQNANEMYTVTKGL